MNHFARIRQNAEARRQAAQLAGFVEAPVEATKASAKVTVRASGKCHPATQDAHGFVLACSCPGSQSGRLAKSCVKVAEGWDAANCRA